MGERKIYFPEFKSEAIVLVDSSAQPASAVAHDLGIRPALLDRRRTEQKAPGPRNSIPRDEEFSLLQRGV